MIHTDDTTGVAAHDDTSVRRRGRKGAASRTKGRAKGTKPEEHGRRMTGRVSRMLYGQSHGFIRGENVRDVFFHRKDAPALFNSLNVDDQVVFELIDDPIAGPRAVHVTRAEDDRPQRAAAGPASETTAPGR